MEEEQEVSKNSWLFQAEAVCMFQYPGLLRIARHFVFDPRLIVWTNKYQVGGGNFVFVRLS